MRKLAGLGQRRHSPFWMRRHFCIGGFGRRGVGPQWHFCRRATWLQRAFFHMAVACVIDTTDREARSQSDWQNCKATNVGTSAGIEWPDALRQDHHRSLRCLSTFSLRSWIVDDLANSELDLSATLRVSAGQGCRHPHQTRQQHRVEIPLVSGSIKTGQSKAIIAMFPPYSRSKPKILCPFLRVKNFCTC